LALHEGAKPRDDPAQEWHATAAGCQVDGEGSGYDGDEDQDGDAGEPASHDA
jgi:hypothetical protein